MNEKCQVFTPENYVEKLLDSAGYIEHLYGKRILENSCGDGNILVSIVRRYILDCRRNGLIDSKIKMGLEQDIYGIEIDKKHFSKCLENLNQISELEKIDGVKWNIFNVDYLKWDMDINFDYIVGNPPYLTYSDIEETDRMYVKENFITCKEGKFDYCYAFIEKSLLSLENNGKMAYLIPSSIFKTVFGENLRNMMKSFVTRIIDYTEEKIFNNALVKSAIMVLENNKKDNQLSYIDATSNISLKINVNNLADKWFFTNAQNLGTRQFGDYFQVSHVVATLLNEAYVIKEWKEENDYIVCNNYRIERGVIRETATPRSRKYNKKEMIIFPYYYDNGNLNKYSIMEFEMRFPGAALFLNINRKKLDKRKKDKNAKWFEYGRSQALVGLDSEKLLVSTVITEEVNVYSLNRECIPYAGMYIATKTEEMSLEDAVNILKSDEFMGYVKAVGIHISGNSLRITSRDIMEYKF
ncbi:MAG TPA: SAM-dependent methyltransferase [Lachnoclostridium phytofermentans]|uniref:site-specific DNA-methyltransferase (adenine-specific) n=1 Tax=Lachnoclostridium phytofermentans TaxID=66219 RepID=A0A3D2X9X1_9FIRM|nr:N-6 DNA methylase [Lachnoclostridium sp.]HCL03786.1 SAM-dependent methyltransferase [Lachnoclostridium phytofermentans]